MAGKKGDLEFIINSDPNPAIQAMAKVIAKQEQGISKLKDTNRESKRTQRSFQEMGGPLNKIVSEVGQIATGMLTAQAVASLVKGAYRGLVEEIQTVRRLQKEMLHDAAIPLEQMAQGLASLMPGGISPENMQASTSMITGLSKNAGIGLPSARNAAFFAYSAFGPTEAGQSAAATIAKITATGQLKDDQLASLPGLFKVIGAETEAAQMEAVNKLVQATKGSIAETGPFIPEFVKSYPQLKAGGHGYDEALALMVAAVTATAGNVPEAGTRIESASKYTAFPSSQAAKFMASFAERQGQDFSAMQPKERFELTREAYQEALREGTITTFGSAFGTKAMQGFGALFTEEAEGDYRASLETVRGTDLGMIDREFEQYKKLLAAQKNKLETVRQELRAETGTKYAGVSEFDQMVTDILEQTKAEGENLPYFWSRPESLERRDLSRLLIDQALLAATEEARASGDTERAQRGAQLRNRVVPFNVYLQPSEIQAVSEFTGGFQSLVGRDIAMQDEWTNSHQWQLEYAVAGTTVFAEQIERYFSKLEAALEKNTQAVEAQNRQSAMPAMPQFD
jgi:hypothetical protein